MLADRFFNLTFNRLGLTQQQEEQELACSLNSCWVTYQLRTCPVVPGKITSMWWERYGLCQPSLPTPFYSVLVSISVFMALSTVFHSITFSRQLAAFSLCSSGLFFFFFSAFLVLSVIYLFMKVSFSPDIILCG